jgi:hypothetical protein
MEFKTLLSRGGVDLAIIEFLGVYIVKKAADTRTEGGSLKIGRKLG